MTINFYLKNKSEDSTSIILHLYDNKLMRWSIRETISPSEWDNKRQKPKKRHQDYLYLSSYIQKCYDHAKAYYQFCRLNGKATCKEGLYNWMNKNVFDVESERKAGVIEWMNAYNDRREKNKEIKHRTVKQHRAFIRSLDVAITSYSQPVSWNTMNQDFWDHFTQMMLDKGGKNNLKKAMQVVSFYLKIASKERQVNQSFRDVKVKRTNTDRIYLSMDELLLPSKYVLSDRQQEAYDTFLIGALTGLRFSDYSALTKANVIYKSGKPYLRKRTQKVNLTITIPLHDRVVAILDRYDALPIFNNTQKFNVLIRRVFEIAGLDQLVTVSKNKHGDMVDLTKPKWQFVSSHTARTSFITNLLIAGVHDRHVMMLAGISSYDTLKTYQRLKPSESAKIAAQSDFFTKWAV